MARLFTVISDAAGCLGFREGLADHLDEFLAEEPAEYVEAALPIRSLRFA